MEDAACQDWMDKADIVNDSRAIMQNILSKPGFHFFAIAKAYIMYWISIKNASLARRRVVKGIHEEQRKKWLALRSLDDGSYDEFFK